jgi:crotonobetainyl-CoA:carnitine CoA-transferase CaiB-like acyl-CoA transferase
MTAIASDLKILDLGLGFASAVLTKFLADNGARVTRIQPPTGDPFAAVYPAYEALKAGEFVGELRDLDALLATADACVIGGEDYPGVDFKFDPESLRARNPKLIVVQLGAYVEGGPVGRCADILVQARSGLVHEQINGRPLCFAMALPSYGAALTGLLGLWAAIIERDRTGLGQVVFATMQQGVSLFWSQIWMQADKSDALFDKLPPKDVKHLIFECAGADYIHFVLGVPGAVAKLYEVLRINVAVDPNERGVPTLSRGPDSYFADRALLEPAIRQWNCAELCQAMMAAGLAAERVQLPGEAWKDPQVLAGGLLTQLPDGSRVFGNPVRFVAPGVTQTDPPRPRQGQATTGAPLAGLQIVDLGNFIAGPFSSKLLADLGADVIRIEPPGSLATLTGIRNTWCSNRGKRSVVIDMKTARGLALAQRLCAHADVALHNFRLGVAERLGVDPESLRRLRPDIVTLAATGYGSRGPKAKNAGWDMVMQALCGHEARAGGRGNAPLWYRSALIDFATGALGAIAILMALHARNRGVGSIEVETSLMATGLFLMSELIETGDGEQRGAPLLNAKKTGFLPAEQLYQTRDGWIAVAARSQPMATALLDALGIEDVTLPRGAWDDAIAERIGSEFAKLETDAAASLLKTAGVWFERCVSDGWKEIRNAAYARESQLVIEAQDPVYGRILSTFGPPVRFSRSNPTGPFRSAPHPGEHTREVLTEAGIAPGEINDLLASKVIA